MDTNTINLVYFSPTHTSRKIVQGIASGMTTEKIDHFDLTLPSDNADKTIFSKDDFVIFGMPVYAGRVPADAVARLEKIQGTNTPAAIIVVYGNRDYEDALLELKNIVSASGFKPVAAGAFIGEHSFSTQQFPIAVGRPDNADIIETTRFGQSITKKLSAAANTDNLAVIDVPGNFPYKEGMVASKAAASTNNENCTMCGTCETVCPTGAISYTESVITDNDKCILCCACIKNCPSDARELALPPLIEKTQWLSETCKEPRKPEVFI